MGDPRHDPFKQDKQFVNGLTRVRPKLIKDKSKLTNFMSNLQVVSKLPALTQTDVLIVLVSKNNSNNY